MISLLDMTVNKNITAYLPVFFYTTKLSKAIFNTTNDEGSGNP
jgi:hypothetical protein